MGNTRFKRWPIEPVQAAVELRGGSVHELAVKNGFSKEHAGKLADIYRCGIRDGFLTLRGMDSICCDALNLHPIIIYGDDYLSGKYDNVKPLKPCESCGGPKSKGSTHYCDECREKKNQAYLCKCGCGTPIPARSNGKVYADRSHRPSERNRKHVATRKPKVPA